MMPPSTETHKHQTCLVSNRSDLQSVKSHACPLFPTTQSGANL